MTRHRTVNRPSPRAAGLAAVALLVCLPGGTGAQPAAPRDALVDREQELLRQYRDLERSFLRLADLLAASDPRRAAVLRGVFDKARAEQVGDRLDTIVALLEKGQFLKAGTSQAGAVEQLRALLDLLESGDAQRQQAGVKEEVRQYLSRLVKSIARQKDIEGSTEAGAQAAEVAERQRALADETRALAEDLERFARRMDAGPAAAGADHQATPAQAADPPASGGQQDGETQEGQAAEPGPSAAGAPAAADEGEPDGDDDAARAQRTRQRLAAAERRMRSARERLEEARRQDARREQQQAVEELETARAELEEILRQLREQEVERLLVQLETRIREMLAAQRQVVAGADAVVAAGTPDRERELEAARLAREQQRIADEAARALLLVRDDGSAVAIPQALESIRDDAGQAATRLGRGAVDGTTRGLLADLVTNLEELLAALEKSQRDQQRRQAGPAGGRPQEPGEQPLVDKLSELKMIRSLQLRVNARTQRFARLLDDTAEATDAPELRAALDRLAERQRKIERAAHDIVTGQTEE